MEWGTVLLQAGCDTTGAEAAIAVTGVAFGCLLVIVAVWQIASVLRARMSGPREEAYRKMAEEVVAVQRQTTEALDRMTSELTELRERTAEVERLLKEVG